MSGPSRIMNNIVKQKKEKQHDKEQPTMTQSREYQKWEEDGGEVNGQMSVRENRSAGRKRFAAQKINTNLQEKLTL